MPLAPSRGKSPLETLLDIPPSTRRLAPTIVLQVRSPALEPLHITMALSSSPQHAFLLPAVGVSIALMAEGLKRHKNEKEPAFPWVTSGPVQRRGWASQCGMHLNLRATSSNQDNPKDDRCQCKPCPQCPPWEARPNPLGYAGFQQVKWMFLVAR